MEAARAEAEQYGFSYPIDAAQGVSFEEALAWTRGRIGHNKEGYKTEAGFCEWLRRVQYRYFDTGRITPKGFELVLGRDRERQRKYRGEWKRTHKTTRQPKCRQRARRSSKSRSEAE